MKKYEVCYTGGSMIVEAHRPDGAAKIVRKQVGANNMPFRVSLAKNEPKEGTGER